FIMLSFSLKFRSVLVRTFRAFLNLYPDLLKKSDIVLLEIEVPHLFSYDLAKDTRLHDARLTPCNCGGSWINRRSRSPLSLIASSEEGDIFLVRGTDSDEIPFVLYIWSHCKMVFLDLSIFLQIFSTE